MTEWGDTTLLGGHFVTNTFNTLNQRGLDPTENLMYVASGGVRGKKPDYNSTFYPAGDLGIMRSDWNKNAVFGFINARTGGFHSHPDALAMTMYAYGRRLITDTGVASYDGNDPIAYWQRLLTTSQNTIEINDIPQLPNAYNEKELQPPSGSQMIINGGFDMFTGWQEANVQGTNVYHHARNVLFVRPSFFIVSDYVEAPPVTGENKYNTTWHMHPTANISYNENTKVAKSNFSEGANVYVIPADPEKLDGKLDDGFGYAKTSKYLSYVQNKAGNITYDTILYPYQQGNSDMVKVERIPMDVDTTVATSLKLLIGEDVSYYYYSHEDTPALRNFGDFQTDAKMVYIEMKKNGNVGSISLVGGSSVRYRNEPLLDSGETIGDMKITIGAGTLYVNSQSQQGKTELPILFKTAESIRKVLLNGVDLSFSCTGGYIQFSDKGDTLPVMTNPQTGAHYVVVPQMKVNLPFNYNYLDYSISATVSEGTVITGGSDWDGRVFSPSVQVPHGGAEGCFAINSLSGRLTFDKPVRIIISYHKNSAIRVPGGSVTVLSKDSETDALRAFENGFTHALFPSGENLVIYAKNSDTIYIGAIKPSIGTGGGVSGGAGTSGGVGNGSGTNGGIGTPGGMSDDTEPRVQVSSFGDIQDHWAKDDILKLHEVKIINGISETEFAPDKPVLRTEFVSLIVRALGLSNTPYQGGFTDVAESDWFADNVQAATDNSIVAGNGDGTFRPSGLITRQEMTKMIMNAYAYRMGEYKPEIDSVAAFADGAQIAEWAVKEINSAKELGIVSGVTEDIFAPLDNSTRAQAAVMIARLLRAFAADEPKSPAQESF